MPTSHDTQTHARAHAHTQLHGYDASTHYMITIWPYRTTIFGSMCLRMYTILHTELKIIGLKHPSNKISALTVIWTTQGKNL